MIINRQRGLNNVNSLVFNITAVALLPISAVLLPLISSVRLSENVTILPYCAAAFLGMAASAGHIRNNQSRLHTLRTWGAFRIALRQTFYVAACIFAWVFATKDYNIGRLFLGSYLILLAMVLTVMHRRLPKSMATVLFGGDSKMPTLFIGRGGRIEKIEQWIAARKQIGILPVGFLAEELPTRAELAIAPYLGTIDKLKDVLRDKRISQVILLEWFDDSSVVEEMIQICEHEGCRFLIHNNYGARYARAFTPLEEGGLHFLALQNEPLEDPINRGAKRLMDIAISLPVVLFVLPPLCAIVWAVQRVQAPGPMFFVKPRGGRNRQDFRMFKFRSMYMWDHDINKQATAGDARIYPFGRLLRKTSLDEFPQFINVLLGDMSVVGPRPHLPKHDEEFSMISRNYRVRSLVKPGITGLAQVNGYRGEITDPEKLHRRVYWDIYYVSNWSIGMDIQIVLRTAIQVFFPLPSAY